MSFSVLIALVFTPALCATMLKPHKPGVHEKKGFFGWFNRSFDKSTLSYERGVTGILARRWRFMFIYLALIAVVAVLFVRIPTAFLPDEDQGIMAVQIQLPQNSSAERTEAVLTQVRDFILDGEGERRHGIHGQRF